jgi:hypothetical protein
LDEARVDGGHRACVVRRRFRVAGRVDGVLGPSLGGRRRSRRRLRALASGGKMAVRPGGATACAACACVGLYRAREAYWTRRRTESHSQDAKRSSFHKRLAWLASVLQPLATFELRES